MMLRLPTLLLVPLLGFVLAVAGASPASAIRLEIQTSATDILEGETVDVDVLVFDLENGGAPAIGSFEFEVGFAGTVLGAEAGSIGFGTGLGASVCGFPPTTGCDAIVESAILANGVEFASAALDLAAVEAAQPDSFLLASFQVRGVGPGATVLNFAQLALGDTGGQPLSAAVTTATVTVTALPEAATAGLLAAGLLLGLGRMRGPRAER